MLLHVLFHVTTIYTSFVCGFIAEGNYIPNNRTDALEFLLVEEKQIRINLEAKLTNLMNRMTSIESEQDKCGCLNGSKTGSKAAFMATLTQSVHCIAKQPLIFDSVKLNTGTAYQPTHGVFTAPVNGTYAFFASLSTPPNNFFRIGMVKNNIGNAAGLYLHANHHGIPLERSSNVVIHMQKGDEVWIICLDNSFIEGDHSPGTTDIMDYHSQFSGFLVSEV